MLKVPHSVRLVQSSNSAVSHREVIVKAAFRRTALRLSWSEIAGYIRDEEDSRCGESSNSLGEVAFERVAPVRVRLGRVLAPVAEMARPQVRKR